MNFLGSIFGFGSPSATTAVEEDSRAANDGIKSLPGSELKLAEISFGQFFLVKKNTTKGLQCIFANATAAVKKAPTTDYAFHLVISPVNVVGDLLSVADGGKARGFLIKEALRFRVDLGSHQASLLWEDRLGQSYQYLVIGIEKSVVEAFSQCVYLAMYKQKYKEVSDTALPEDLQEFVVECDAPKHPTKAKISKTTIPVFNSASKGLVSNPTVVDARWAARGNDKVDSPTMRMPAIISKAAELFLWHKESTRYVKQADILVSIERHPPSYEYYIIAISGDHQQLLACKISSDFNPRWSTILHSVTWNHAMLFGQVETWSIKFKDGMDFEEFNEAYSLCVSEALYAVEQKGKASGQRLFTPPATTGTYGTTNNVESDIESLRSDSESHSETNASDDEESEVVSRSSAGQSHLAKGESNSLLAVGHGNNRTFVARGEKIGVFTHSDEPGGKLKYTGTIKGLGFKEAKPFEPDLMMLHDQDTKLLLTDPLRKHSLFSMDIERGKIVEEWKVNKDIGIKALAPSSKYSQITGEQTLVGISDNALFRIDPRRGQGSKINELQPYSTKTKFTDVSTTADGKIAVSAEKGDIRLFDAVGKIAKSTLPAMGDAIVGLDVTGDGRWLVATCKTYLLVIDTLITKGRYTDCVGFDHPFPADSKPRPKRLELRPEHVSLMNNNISLTPAKFDMGGGEEEKAIVTSTGRYVIAFDFAKVKKNKLNSYVIKRYDNEVIQDNFRFGDGDEIVVALTNNVLSLNTKSLKK